MRGDLNLNNSALLVSIVTGLMHKEFFNRINKNTEDR
jgi:hypothetical protein